MSPHSPAAAISAEVAGIHAAAYERESERASTLLDDDLAMCVLRNSSHPPRRCSSPTATATPSMTSAKPSSTRSRPALSAAVERITSRTVISFLPTTHLTPSLTLLTFGFARGAARRLRADRGPEICPNTCLSAATRGVGLTQDAPSTPRALPSSNSPFRAAGRLAASAPLSPLTSPRGAPMSISDSARQIPGVAAAEGAIAGAFADESDSRSPITTSRAPRTSPRA